MQQIGHVIWKKIFILIVPILLGMSARRVFTFLCVEFDLTLSCSTFILEFTKLLIVFGFICLSPSQLTFNFMFDNKI